MDFKGFLEKQQPKREVVESSTTSNHIQEGEEMTQEQFQLLLNEIKGLRQDINKLNEGYQPTQVRRPLNPQPAQPPAGYKQPTGNIVKDSRGFQMASNPGDIMAAAKNILG